MGRPKSTIEQRLEWLRQNPALVAKYPDTHNEIVRRMKDAGLFSRSTYRHDIKLREMIDKVIAERDDAMRFVEHLKWAQETVSQWPEWKKQVMKLWLSNG